MSQIIGFYNDSSQAKRVRDELVSEGFDPSQIHVFNRAERMSASGATGQSSDRGFWESVKEFFGFAGEEDRHLYAEAAHRGACGVSVEVDDAEDERRATEILRRGNAIDLDQQANQWRQQGWRGRYAGAEPGTQTQPAPGKEQVVPVVQEELQVGKRQVQSGGIRIHSRVTEKPVEEQVELREEHVNVERRPVDRPVTAADQGAFQERTIEATESVERPVVSKEARVVEEVAVNKDVEQRTETIRDKVRRTDVDVERTGQGEATSAGTLNDPDRFASELVSDERFRGRDWDAVEPDARRDFEKRYPGSKWDQFKEAIHQGYEKVRQKV